MADEAIAEETVLTHNPSNVDPQAELRRRARRNAIVEGMEGERGEERNMIVLEHAMSLMAMSKNGVKEGESK